MPGPNGEAALVAAGGQDTRSHWRALKDVALSLECSISGVELADGLLAWDAGPCFRSEDL